MPAYIIQAEEMPPYMGEVITSKPPRPEWPLLTLSETIVYTGTFSVNSGVLASGRRREQPGG